MSTISYGSASVTRYLSMGDWHGKKVSVEEPLWAECGPCVGHDLAPMTHFGERTGGLYCWRCCGFTLNLGLESDFD